MTVKANKSKQVFKAYWESRFYYDLISRVVWNYGVKDLYKNTTDYSKIESQFKPLKSEHTKLNLDSIPRKQIKVNPQTPIAESHNYNEMNLETTVKANQESKYVRVTIRQVSQMFTRALNVKLNSDEYLNHVESIMRIIEDMPEYQRHALKLAFLFSMRVAQSDREDFYQDIVLTLLEKRIENEKLAYTIARCDWLDWYRKYRKKQDNEVSLNAILDSMNNDNESDNDKAVSFKQLNTTANWKTYQDSLDKALQIKADMELKSELSDNDPELSDLLINAIEYEQTQSKAHRIVDSIRSLPNGKQILEIATKRLGGKALNNTERSIIHRFVAKNPVYYLTN